MAASPLRIAIVSTEAGWYGGEEQARLLAEGLRRSGHDCHVLARSDGRFARGMRERGFRTTEFPGAGHSPVALRILRRAVRRFLPDVLHANDPRAMTAAGLATLGMHVPCRVAARRVSFVPRSPWAYRWLCDRVICVSQAARVQCLDARIPQSHLCVVPDGVDPRRFAAASRSRGRAAIACPDETPIVLSVAALEPSKGHRDLLQAFAKLPAPVDAHLVLAGDGSERARLEQLSRDAGIAGRTTWLGYRTDVPDLMLAADVVVLASSAEGLGSSLIEAMLAERAIVATRVGGIPELLAPDPNGNEIAWLTKPGDPGALASAIQQALQQRTEAMALGQRAGARARQCFLASHMIRDTERVYRKVLASRMPSA